MSNKITLPAILDSYRPRKDGSFSITFGTNVLNSEQRNILMNMYSQLCCIMVKDSGNATDIIEFTEEERKIFEQINFKEIDTKQTKSQRQKSDIWLIWKQEGEKGEFVDYYNNYMDKIHSHLISKLDT